MRCGKRPALASAPVNTYKINDFCLSQGFSITLACFINCIAVNFFEERVEI